MPSKEELIPFSNQLQAGALHFGKSTRTIRRWLERHGIYHPEKKYRPGKVTPEMASKIRELDRASLTQSEIAKIVGISQPMVGRIINNNLKLRGCVKVVFKPHS